MNPEPHTLNLTAHGTGVALAFLPYCQQSGGQRHGSSERQVILKETHLEVMCRFHHLTFNYTAQNTMEGTEFYDVTFAVEDDKEISIVLELNPENSAVVVIDEVLEPTRDTLARDEVEGYNVAKAPTEKDVSQDTFKYEGRHFNNKLYHILDCSVQSNVNLICVLYREALKKNAQSLAFANPGVPPPFPQ